MGSYEMQRMDGDIIPGLSVRGTDATYQSPVKMALIVVKVLQHCSKSLYNSHI
jgi:hypothetical protein